MKYRSIVLAAWFGIFAIICPLAAEPISIPPARRPAATTTRLAQTPASPDTLAVVNGRAITLADLDPETRAAVEGFDKKMPELRRDALNARIDAMLLEAEAQKRKVIRGQLMDAEVYNLIKDPTDTEIQAFYDANKQQMGDPTLESVRSRIIGYLRDKSGQRLFNDLITRLRSSYQVVLGKTDVNAPNLAPATVLATVGGRAITAGEFEERLKPVVHKLRYDVFYDESRVLDLKINQILLEAEAKKRNTTLENVFKAEVTDKVRQPTDAEVTKFYDDNKADLKGDLDSLRPNIAALLKNQQLSRLESDFAQRLRAGASVQVFLKKPEFPVLAISTDDDPSRGLPSAPVTIVEFTDFQCCAVEQLVIDETLKSYGNRVRLVVRDYPLVEYHAQAWKAAEAAGAANAQGKFFEYIAVLFKKPSALDVASLKKYASELGLDRARFDASLDSGQYAAEVDHDVADGEAYGVGWVPTIFINGVRLDSSPARFAEQFRAAIDKALATKAAPKQ